jgi:hypothetical protein
MATGGGQVWVWTKPVALSKECLKNVFKNTKHLYDLCHNLNIPCDKRNVEAAVEYFSQSKQPMKVRRFIWWLDCFGETDLADSVMSFAEPPADPSLSPPNLIPVFQAITGCWEMIDSCRTVPHARVTRFYNDEKGHYQLTAKAGKYFALYHHDPNWREFSVSLYQAGETKAVQIARPHILTVADPSLSPPNLIPVFQAITGCWEMIDSCRTVPHARVTRFYNDEKGHYQLTAKAGKYFALYHHDPNWREFSVSLYQAGETKAVQIARPHILTVADRSLTVPKILHAARQVPLWSSQDSYVYLKMARNQHEETKEKLITAWLAGHPCPNWECVRDLLRGLERQGRGRAGAADEVEETYLKSELQYAE